jgi:hypothetical protein
MSWPPTGREKLETHGELDPYPRVGEQPESETDILDRFTLGSGAGPKTDIATRDTGH